MLPSSPSLPGQMWVHEVRAPPEPEPPPDPPPVPTPEAMPLHHRPCRHHRTHRRRCPIPRPIPRPAVAPADATAQATGATRKPPHEPPPPPRCEDPVFLNTLPRVGPCSPRAGYVSGEAHTNRGEQSTCMLFEVCCRVSQYAPHGGLSAFLSPLRRRLLADSASPPRRRLLAASSPPPRLTRTQARRNFASAHVVHVQIVHVQDVHNYVFVRVMIVLSRVHGRVSRLCVFFPRGF